MKKTVTIFFVMMILVALLAMPVHAAGSGSVAMGSANAKQGETVTLKVSMPSNPGLVTMSIKVSYDTNLLQLTKVSDTGLLKGAQLNTSYGSPYTVSWVDGTATANNTKTGTIASFTFQVKDSAPIGSTTVKLQFVDSYDTEYGENRFSASSGKITVSCKNHSFGDWKTSGDSQHARTCAVCGTVSKENHDWNSGKVTKEATCQETGSRIRTCKVCAATKDEEIKKAAHSFTEWESVDESTHTRSCTVCKKKETKSHAFDMQHDETMHYAGCKNCGFTKDPEAHIPGPEATATTDQVCTVCERVLQIRIDHPHELQEGWLKDEQGHWNSCALCDQKCNFAEHIYEDNCKTQCSVCAAERIPPHDPDGAWQSDAQGHWQLCGSCGVKVMEGTHNPGEAATTYVPQTCTDCAYVLAPVLPHEHFDGCHSHICPCGEVYDADADCPICQEARQDFPWWIVCIAEGVLLIVSISLNIWFKVKKRDDWD